MSEKFPNQDFGVSIHKHKNLPIFETNSFDFFRCIPFNESFYGKSVMELHNGNLRIKKAGNRYSNIFPGQKLSYWADSPQTARAEVKHWGANNNLITFWAYDDGSSSIPTIYPPEPLYIIDGREIEFNKILIKQNNGEKLNSKEQDIVDSIAYEKPDCLAYESEQRQGGMNYLFFEQGFKKLSLRQVSLRLGSEPSKNYNKVICATGSDYSPYLKGYCAMFMPKAKVEYNDNVANSDDIKLKLDVVLDWAQRRLRY